MARGTTFTLPNYTGALFELSRKPAAFLAAIGGLNQMRVVKDVQFGLTTYSVGSYTNGDRLEGADAPAGTQVARSGASNVLEIFHETVDLSYTKMAATDKLASDAVNGVSSVVNELPWQVQQTIIRIARTANYQFINGSYAFPSDNNSARKTRGLLEAISTNVTAADSTAFSSAVLAEVHIEDCVKNIFDSGGLENGETNVILCNSTQKLHLDALYGSSPTSITIGGVELQVLYTPLGSFAIMLDRMMPQDVIAFASLDVISPVGLLIPSKGVLFEEPLAKIGSSERSQIYGELGLDYGPESYHGKITGLSTALPTHA